MIRTARAHPAEILRPLRIGKRQRILRAVEVRDDAAVRGDDAAQIRQDLGDGRLRDPAPSAVTPAPPNSGLPARARVLLDEVAHLVDGADAVQVALVLRLAPREQAVAAENQAVAARASLRRRASASAPARSPGRCHGTQMIFRPYVRLNSCIFRSPLALAASAIAQSGCR